MMVSNCPRCQIVRGVKLSSLHGRCQIILGVKFSAVSNCPITKLSCYFYLLTPLINSFHKTPMHTFNLLNTKAQQTHEFSALTKAQPHSIFQTD